MSTLTLLFNPLTGGGLFFNTPSVSEIRNQKYFTMFFILLEDFDFEYGVGSEVPGTKSRNSLLVNS